MYGSGKTVTTGWFTHTRILTGMDKNFQEYPSPSISKLILTLPEYFLTFLRQWECSCCHLYAMKNSVAILKSLKLLGIFQRSQISVSAYTVSLCNPGVCLSILSELPGYAHAITGRPRTPSGNIRNLPRRSRLCQAMLGYGMPHTTMINEPLVKLN